MKSIFEPDFLKKIIFEPNFVKNLFLNLVSYFLMNLYHTLIIFVSNVHIDN